MKRVVFFEKGKSIFFLKIKNKGKKNVVFNEDKKSYIFSQKKCFLLSIYKL